MFFADYLLFKHKAFQCNHESYESLFPANQRNCSLRWYDNRIRGLGRKSHFFENGKIVAFSHL